MSNSNAPFGFRPVRRLDGAVPNCSILEREIKSDNTTKIHQFAPVKELATGYIDLAGAADYPIYGVLEGVEYYDTALKQYVFAPAWLAPSTALAGSVKARITPAHSAQVFEVQSSGAVIDIAAIGANANHAAGTANDTTGLSGASLDQTTLNTTNTLQWRVIGLSKRGGNDNTSSYNIVEVIAVNNSFTATTGIHT